MSDKSLTEWIRRSIERKKTKQKQKHDSLPHPPNQMLIEICYL